MKNSKTPAEKKKVIGTLKNSKISLLGFFAIIALASVAVFSTTASAGSLKEFLSGVSGTTAAIFNFTETKSNPATSNFPAESNFVQQTATDSLVEARRGHTATDLGAGKILIVGGNQNGAATAEILDSSVQPPVSATIDPDCATAANCLPLSGHTATKLSDGSVLIIGGKDANGNPVQRAVAFDPSNNQFSEAAFSLINPRSGHTATMIADGKILVAGGDQTSSAEIIDLATNTASYTGGMSAVRFDHSAALMRDGRVLLVGGKDAAGQELGSAEIFDGSAFAQTVNEMARQRVAPLLRVLPDGKVQIIGGSADESMEVYNPAEGGGIFGAHGHVVPESDSNEHATLLKADILSAETRAALIRSGSQDAALDRGGYTVTEVAGINKALVVGGANNSGALNTVSVYNTSQATITTDKLDYQPGQTAVLRGTGWQPGETVRIIIHEDPHTHTERRLTPVADADGNFTANYLVEQHDLSVKFVVGAKGATSQRTAQTTFTDAVGLSFFNAASAGCGTAATSSGSPSLPTYNFGNGVCVKMSGLGSTDHFTSWVSPVGGTAFTGTAVNNGNSSEVKTPNAAGVWTFKVYSNPAKTIEVASAQFRVTTFTGKLVFTNNAFSVVAEACSPALKIQLQNSSGIPVSNLSFPTTVALSSNSGGTKAFYSDASCTTAVSSTEIPVNSSDTLSFFYKDSAIGNPVLTGTSSGLTPATQTETITAACSNATVGTQPTNQTVVYGAATVSFTAAANGTPTPSVQWQTSTNGGASFTNLSNAAPYSGVTTGTLTIANPATSLNGTRYRAVFSNNCNTTESNAASLTVNKATPVVNWNNPADIAYGAALGATQLNATVGSNLAGSFEYTPAAGAVLGAGDNQTLSVKFTPADTANYEIVTKTVAINVARATPTVSVTGGSFGYNAAPRAASGFAYGNGGTNDVLTPAVTFGYVGTGGTTYGPTDAAPTAAGTYQVTANFAGNASYAAASNTAALSISKKAASVTPSAAGKTYGGAEPALSGALDGFIQSDNVTAAYSRTAGEAVSGIYTISAVLSPASVLGNYDVTYNTAAFTINPAGLTVAADNKARRYGETNPDFTGTVTGIQNGDNITATYASAATATSPVAGYSITPTLVDPDNKLANYTVTSNNGTLTISPAELTVKANDKNRAYGAANPAFDAVITGFKNSEDASVLTAQPVCSSTAGASSTVAGGPYEIVCSAAAAANYTFAYVNGQLTVTKATATIELSGLSQTYDGNPKSATATTDPADLSGVAITYNGSATAPTDANSYAVVATLTNDNYQATNAEGSLVIGKAATTTSVICNAGPFTFTGTAIAPCSATVAGPNGLNESLTVNYADNVNAGTATASAGYAESANYQGSTDSKTFSIGKAATLTAVTCTGSPIYTGSPVTPCAVSVTGPNGFNLTPAPDYANNVNAGTATASYTYAGDANYLGSSDSEEFTIGKATATLTLSGLSHTYDGTAKSATATTSPENLTGVSFTYDGSASAPTDANGYAVVASLNNVNYDAVNAEGTLVIGQADQVITWATPAAITYGTALGGTQLNAAVAGVNGGSAPGALSYDPASGTVLGFGTHTLTVNAAATTNYKAAEKSVTLSVNKAALTVKANNKSKTYGYAPVAFDVSYSGFVNGDTPASLGGALAFNFTDSASTPVGSDPITPSGLTSSNYAITFVNGALTVNKRKTKVTFMGPVNAIYGSCLEYAAMLEDIGDGNLAPSPVSSATITLSVGNQSAPAVTGNDGVARVSLSAVNNVGGTTAGASFAGDTTKDVGTASVPFSVIAGSAAPLASTGFYTGESIFWTTSTSTSTATLTLAATIKDVTSTCAGDIRTARVTFAIRNSDGSFTPINGASNLPVGLVTAGDTKVGTASAVVQYNIGAASSATLDIAVIVGGNYKVNNPNWDAVINVSKPVTGQIIGAGLFDNTSTSRGFIAGALNQVSSFGFDVKYNKSGTNPQGSASFYIRSFNNPDGTLGTVLRTYRVKSNSITSLSVVGTKATFSSKANISEMVTNPDGTIASVPIDGGAILQLSMTDGSPDTLAVTVQNSRGGLWFSNNWNGTKTLEQIISGNKISVK